jgi:phosphatidate cytidylyltransferase
MNLIFSIYEILYFISFIAFFVLDYIYNIKFFNKFVINVSVLEYSYCCIDKNYSLYSILYGLIWMLPIFLIANNYFVISDDDGLDIFKLIWLNSISDMVQSFIGKLLGKYISYKPFKSISPSKTLIGYIGGLTITYILAIFIEYNNIVILLVLNVLGDLVASFIKRKLLIKDFSTLFGNKGGMLDRIDSSTLNIPFNYFYKHYLIGK